MHFAGIDIGSRTIELVVVNRSGEIVDALKADTGFDPMTGALELVNSVSFDRIVATGYGRSLFELSFDASTVTEIKAHAVGVKAAFPDALTVLDIGGQDSKVISLFENGRVRKFEMNDRCAAGTGKFLEIMASALGFSIEEFGRQALASKKELVISSMCTVFAESEVTTLIARGEDRRDIARAVHLSVVNRAASMIGRVSLAEKTVFTGGVAQNPCVVSLLSEKLGRPVLVPELPQFTGAFGAALIAMEQSGQRLPG